MPDQIELTDKRSNTTLIAEMPVSMYDLTHIFYSFAIILGYSQETIEEYIVQEGISSIVYNACRNVRKEYEMREHPIEENDETC